MLSCLSDLATSLGPLASDPNPLATVLKSSREADESPKVRLWPVGEGIPPAGYGATRLPDALNRLKTLRSRCDPALHGFTG